MAETPRSVSDMFKLFSQFKTDISDMLVKVNNKLDGLAQSITDIKATLDVTNQKIQKIRETVDGLKMNHKDLVQTVDDLEQHDRRHSVRIFNLSPPAHVIDSPSLCRYVFEHLISPVLASGVAPMHIDPNMWYTVVSTAHPLPAPNPKVQPIIVRFVSRELCSMFMRKKGKFLQSLKEVLPENLSPDQKIVLAAAVNNDMTRANAERLKKFRNHPDTIRVWFNNGVCFKLQGDNRIFVSRKMDDTVEYVRRSRDDFPAGGRRLPQPPAGAFFLDER